MNRSAGLRPGVFLNAGWICAGSETGAPLATHGVTRPASTSRFIGSMRECSIGRNLTPALASEEMEELRPSI